MKKLVVLALSLALLGGTQAMARDIDFDGNFVSQGEFKEFSRQAGAALSYRNAAPAEPLGITGFDAGVEVTAIDISDEASYMEKAFDYDAPSYLVFPKLRVRKGLPFGIDVGAMYAYVPGSNIELWGGEVSKAILDGTMATPALGVRATYTRLTGVDDLDLQTAGIDASISKGILFLTPYAGAGAVWIDSEPKGNLTTVNPDLTNETFWQPRYFAGLKISPLPILSVTAEAEYQERAMYTLKVALDF